MEIEDLSAFAKDDNKEVPSFEDEQYHNMGSVPP